MRGLAFITFIFLVHVSFGQSGDWQLLRQQGDYFRSLSIEANMNSVEVISTDFAFTSVTIKYPNSQELVNVTLKIGTEYFTIEEDPHSQGEFRTTALITTGIENYTLELGTGSLSGGIEIHLINGSYDSKDKSFKTQRQQKTEVCDEPAVISQSVWRAGLALTNTSRSFSTVEHLIIHHSAGTNTSEDWMEVVRAIFIYHTESNGWSDIGYNYLVDPNGILYAGRDPISGEQDNVIGAHFCGKNTGTMGICIMGTFTLVPPSDKAVTKVMELFAWKATKDKIDVLGENSHAGSNLKNVAGHRDGCSTECPGEMTYDMLPSIRTGINTLMEPCGSATEPIMMVGVYPNPVNGHTVYVQTPFDYQYVKIINALGKVEKEFSVPVDEDLLEFDVAGLQSGLYTLVFENSQNIKTAKVVIAR